MTGFLIWARICDLQGPDMAKTERWGDWRFILFWVKLFRAWQSSSASACAQEDARRNSNLRTFEICLCGCQVERFPIRHGTAYQISSHISRNHPICPAPAGADCRDQEYVWRWISPADVRKDDETCIRTEMVWCVHLVLIGTTPICHQMTFSQAGRQKFILADPVQNPPSTKSRASAGYSKVGQRLCSSFLSFFLYLFIFYFPSLL